MPSTKRRTVASCYHRIPTGVELDRLEDHVINVALGARKQLSEPKGAGEANLRRDVRRKRIRCYGHALKLAFADLRDGEKLENVVAAFQAAIDIIRVYGDSDPDRSINAWIQIETQIEGHENALEVAYLCGDKSHETMMKLDRYLGEHIKDLQELRAAIHRDLYAKVVAA